MGSLDQNIQLKLEFLKGLFLVLHFFCYTLMNFRTVLYVILLSVLILLSTLRQDLELASAVESDLRDTGLEDTGL